MTGQPSAADVLREQVAAVLYEADHPTRMDGWPGAAPRAQKRYLDVARMLTAAGLLATPERLAQERAAALDEAADAVDVIDPQWDSALYVGGVYVPVPDWLHARAEAERAGGGA